VFQVKSSLSETGFKPDDIDKLGIFADHLLHLTLDHREIEHLYESHILRIMQSFKDAYLAVAANYPTLHLDFYYVTRGDEVSLNGAAEEAVRRLRKQVSKHRGASDKDTCDFHPVDTGTLLRFVRNRRQKTRILKWSQQPMPIGNGYVGMVRLRDYFAFLQDNAGHLDELIFESNVRGNQGKSSVNKQMRQALDEGGPPDFWQLNNGITITCSAITPVDAFNLQISDAQVVNGLQTSRQIFGHFSEGLSFGTREQDVRSVLVKLIPVADDGIRDKIIRATNNQNPMRAAALRATDNRQRDIEELFKRFELYYDRRPGFYKDQGKPIQKIVSLTEVVQAVLCTLLQKPKEARGRPGDYIREGREGDDKYRTVFGPKIPLGFYVKAVLIIRKVDAFLKDSGVAPGDRRNLLHYVSYYVVCYLARNAIPSAQEILQIRSEQFTRQALTLSLEKVRAIYQSLATEDRNPDSVAKGPEMDIQIAAELVREYGTTKMKGSAVKGKRIKDRIAEGDPNWAM
jgi:hypothetical protein